MKINTALRVPSVLPNRWVYLRSWTNHHTFQERTWANSVLVCIAQRGEGRCHVQGLPGFTSTEPTIEGNGHF